VLKQEELVLSAITNMWTLILIRSCNNMGHNFQTEKICLNNDVTKNYQCE